MVGGYKLAGKSSTPGKGTSVTSSFIIRTS
jgi:hypothetical protein